MSRIGLVKPQKARQITDLLIRMAQQGQIRGRITEDQLIGLLDQVDQASSGDAGKITVSSKSACTNTTTTYLILTSLALLNPLCAIMATVHTKKDCPGRRR